MSSCRIQYAVVDDLGDQYMWSAYREMMSVVMSLINEKRVNSSDIVEFGDDPITCTKFDNAYGMLVNSKVNLLFLDIIESSSRQEKGLVVLEELRAAGFDAEVILVSSTAYSDNWPPHKTELCRLKHRVAGYISPRLLRDIQNMPTTEAKRALFCKDPDYQSVLELFAIVLEKIRSNQDTIALTKCIVANAKTLKNSFDSPIIHDSKTMGSVMERARKLANSEMNIFLSGETGSGKELFARNIHDWSNRRGKAFVSYNCACIPGKLAESILFGHRKGTFTDATEETTGIIASADKGTLFLDEIAELSLETQAKLLTAIEKKEITKLGAKSSVAVDFRLISATNQCLENLVREGKFREDLYFRIKVGKIDIPPLRDREGDVILLANHFLSTWNRKNNTHVAFSECSLGFLRRYVFPGNVRELQNLIEVAYAMRDIPEVITSIDLSRELGNVSSFAYSAAVDRSDKSSGERQAEILTMQVPAGQITEVYEVCPEKCLAFKEQLFKLKKFNDLLKEKIPAKDIYIRIFHKDWSGQGQLSEKMIDSKNMRNALRCHPDPVTVFPYVIGYIEDLVGRNRHRKFTKIDPKKGVPRSVDNKRLSDLVSLLEELKRKSC